MTFKEKQSKRTVEYLQINLIAHQLLDCLLKEILTKIGIDADIGSLDFRIFTNLLVACWWRATWRHDSESNYSRLYLLIHCLLKGIEYNSSTKGKSASDKEIVSINCESEKWDTEVEKDKKVSLDNVTNAG